MLGKGREMSAPENVANSTQLFFAVFPAWQGGRGGECLRRMCLLLCGGLIAAAGRTANIMTKIKEN